MAGMALKDRNNGPNVYGTRSRRRERKKRLNKVFKKVCSVIYLCSGNSVVNPSFLLRECVVKCPQFETPCVVEREAATKIWGRDDEQERERGISLGLVPSH